VLIIAARKSADFMSCILDGNECLMLCFAVDARFEEFRVTDGEYVILIEESYGSYVYLYNSFTFQRPKVRRFSHVNRCEHVCHAIWRPGADGRNHRDY
jgi:hypothetical protein